MSDQPPAKLSMESNGVAHTIKLDPETVTDFINEPLKYRPRPEYLTDAIATLDDDTVLTHCIKFQNVPAVEVLLQAGADPNQVSRKGIAPISAAAHKGNTAIMQLLIQYGGSVNSMNQTGSTALIQAAHFGHLAAVQLLLSHHASSDFANQKGTTALMRSSQEGHVEISKELLKAGVDVNRKNHEGMNALMLASQRGHADIVYVLVKAGAAMDEQTSQGSTALMLACKRGHEKCAEVLVSMGAEIYMRDRRFRTARDTATRRNHYGLLHWLDTQVQVARVQEGRHHQRAALIAELRRMQDRVRLSDSFESVQALAVVVMRSNQRKAQQARGVMDPQLGATEFSDDRQLGEFIRTGIFMTLRVCSNSGATAASLTPITASTAAIAATRLGTEFAPEFTLTQMLHAAELSQSYNASVLQQPVYPRSSRMAQRHSGYSDWQWAYLLHRCVSLPAGIFELVMEYLPLPRVWQWSLIRLKRRCKLAPHQAVQDLSIIMDEILCDLVIFPQADQKNLLLRLNRSPQIHSFLLERLEMPPALLELLCEFADAQGLLSRHAEQEVTFKAAYARKMLSAAVELYRWYRHRCSALKVLQLSPLGAVSHTRMDERAKDDDNDVGEEASDYEGDIVLDQDTESEMVVEEDGGEVMEDSDSDGAEANLMIPANIANLTLPTNGPM